MTVSEIYEILENSRKLSFEEYNYQVAVFLSTKDISIKKDLKEYINNHCIEFPYNSGNYIKVDNQKYTIYDYEDVTELINDAVSELCSNIENLLGDNSQYFDFNKYLDDNQISIETALGCSEYEVVYDEGREYYITKW